MIDQVVEVLGAELLAGTRGSAQLTQVVDKNLVQGLGVIQNVLIHQHGGTADDAATMAAIRAVAHMPPATGSGGTPQQ